MEVNGKGEISVEHKGDSFDLDTVDWQNRFNLFRKVHLETFNNHLSDEGQRKLNETSPAMTMKAWSKDSSEPETIELLWKDPIMDTYNDEGVLNTWDGARMYARYKGETVLVQRFVFDERMAVPASIKQRSIR